MLAYILGITKRGRCYRFQVGAREITNRGSVRDFKSGNRDFKSGQERLQTEAVITNRYRAYTNA